MSSNPFESPGTPDSFEPSQATSGPVVASFSAIDILKESKEMIGDQYWTFVGIVFLGLLIGSAAPFAIILGPMMCGIYMCLIKKTRGEAVKLELLFKGFDFFKQSFIATMITVGLVLLAVIPLSIVFGVAMAVAGGSESLVMIFIGLFYLAIIVLSIAVGVFFIFSYPLIVDRGYLAWDSIKTSFKAVKMNMGSMLTLMIISSVLGFVGALFCYVGAFLVAPITLGAFALAYRRIFPD